MLSNGVVHDTDARRLDRCPHCKRLSGSGDTVEIQGDQRERIAADLTAPGHKVKPSGG